MLTQAEILEGILSAGLTRALRYARADGALDADSVRESRRILELANDAETVVRLMRAEPVYYEAQHAPTGGVTIQGKFYTGGEFIPGDVVDKATAQEKKQLEGGGKEPEEKRVGKSPEGGGKKREQNILDAAAKIEVSDEQFGGEPVDGDDLDEIENRMTDDEKEEMEDKLEEWKENIIDEAMSGFEPDVDRDEIAAGLYSQKKLLSEAKDLVRDNASGDDDEDEIDELITILDEWYNDRDSDGDTGSREIWKLMQDAPDAIAKAISRWDDNISDEVDDAVKEAEEEAKEEAKVKALDDYDGKYDRRNYLRDFFSRHEDEPRYSGSEEQPLDKWVKDLDGDSVYKFETQAGSTYNILVNKSSHPKYGDYETLQFSDESGSFKVTGAGGAVEVFSKVCSATVALMKARDIETLRFTAAEESRMKLYDRLVRTVAKVMPEYAAVAISHPGSPRSYMVAKRERVKFLQSIAASVGAGQVEQLVN